MAKKVCSIRMSESLLSLLDEQSKAKGIDRNTLIVNLLTEGVGGSVQTKDPNCLYIPESSVPSGMSHQDYKAKVKRETGAKCVFYTGG